MSKSFPDNVKHSVFRLWDVIEAFYNDIVASDEEGFYKLVGERRRQDANLLIEHEIFKFSPRDNCDLCFSLGKRGLDAYEMIFKDPEKCRIYSANYIKEREGTNG